MRGRLIGAAAGLAAVGGALAIQAAASPAKTVALGWNEVAPVCNKVSNAGVTGCAGARYAPAFRVRVLSFTATGTAWSVRAAITNLTTKPLTFTAGPVKLCLFPTAKSARSSCLATPVLPRPLVSLKPGGTWTTTQRGTGRIVAGRWVRFLFPTVRGSFVSPTGNAVQWLTVHAYEYPGGPSVASYVGSG